MSGPLAQMAADMSRAVMRHPLRSVSGQLDGVLGTRLETPLADLVVGDICELDSGPHRPSILAQVVGLGAKGGILSPLGPLEGLSPRSRVRPLWRPLEIICSNDMLGGIFDGLGRPLAGAPSTGGIRLPISPRGIDPLDRPPISEPVATGIRALDAMLTFGKGQRFGVFGSSGSGKTSLVGALARNIPCDVVVLGLIGERGREIREFLERQLPEDVRRRCVVVSSTSDRPAMERVCGAHVATTVAEYFRDQGLHVLLVMDSVTRFARALREVGLAAGETAVRRGFPPTVYSELPRLIERSGATGKGAITAVYTVLSEDESGDDPIVEEVQSLTDGHVHLATRLARAGHYPAIDVLKSNSRLMNEIAARDHVQAARRLRRLMTVWNNVELLIQVGEYRRGADPEADEAIDKHGAIESFLRQDTNHAAHPGQTIGRLFALAAPPE